MITRKIIIILILNLLVFSSFSMEQAPKNSQTPPGQIVMDASSQPNQKQGLHKARSPIRTILRSVVCWEDLENNACKCCLCCICNDMNIDKSNDCTIGLDCNTCEPKCNLCYAHCDCCVCIRCCDCDDN